MSEPRTACTKCGADILQATADANEGRCMRCKPSRKREKMNKEHAWKGALLAFVIGLLLIGVGFWVWWAVVQPDAEGRVIKVGILLIPIVGLYFLFQGFRTIFDAYIRQGND